MSDSIRLHGFWRSLGTYRVRIGEQFQTEISSLNPQCTLPIMLHREHVFSQSLAIIEYIEECFPTPSLLPSSPLERAIVRSFAMITIADAHPLTVPRVRKKLAQQFNASNDDIELWARHWSKLALDAMESRLVEGYRSNQFCFSEKPGLADIALASQVAGARFFNLSIDSYPCIRDVMRNINECDEFVVTAPEAIKAQGGLVQ